MNYDDREKIDRCCNNVSSKINMFNLWPELIRNEVFMFDDVNIPVWEKSFDREDTVRDILYTIKTRGPYAFENLLRSLRKTNHNDVADVINGAPLFANDNVQRVNGASNNIEMFDNYKCVDWYASTKLITSDKPLVINVKHATKFMDEPDSTVIAKYRMRSRPHGYVLIITIKHYDSLSVRRAAEHDHANLKKLFEDMGFEVTVPDPETRLTGAKIKSLVKEFSQRDFHRVDSCFVIISAHGNEAEHNSAPETELHGVDGNLAGAEKVLCSDIVDMFTSENCKDLIEKPKVFIFQACRDKAVKEKALTPNGDRCDTDGWNPQVPRRHSDILIAHSTIPGDISYRDKHNGSWYIQTLCEVFMKHACDMHLDDLLKKVDEILKCLRTFDDRSQTSSVSMMGFHKHMYLNPGIFEDS